MDEQCVYMGMFLALWDWEGDGDAYLTLDRAAEAAEYGDGCARDTLKGAQAMVDWLRTKPQD